MDDEHESDLDSVFMKVRLPGGATVGVDIDVKKSVYEEMIRILSDNDIPALPSYRMLLDVNGRPSMALNQTALFRIYVTEMAQQTAELEIR